MIFQALFSRIRYDFCYTALVPLYVLVCGFSHHLIFAARGFAFRTEESSTQRCSCYSKSGMLGRRAAGESFTGVAFEEGLCRAYSHSMVPGGLLVMSSATRFTPDTSFMMRLLTRSNRS